MGRKHTETLAEGRYSQMAEQVEREDCSQMIQSIMKNGTPRAVMIVIILSSANPLIQRDRAKSDRMIARAKQSRHLHGQHPNPVEHPKDHKAGMSVDSCERNLECDAEKGIEELQGGNAGSIEWVIWRTKKTHRKEEVAGERAA